jgi:3-methyladenine DNA glycosylase/8-oxoguanine DNA glycosylase
MPSDLIVLNVMGPYREPREPAFSHDYSIQRPHWATPQGVRVKVSIELELDYLKNSILAIAGGSVGQQLRINQILLRAIADQKLKIVDADGMLDDRRDVMVGPFVDNLMHLFVPLDQWMKAEQHALRKTIKDQIGI